MRRRDRRGVDGQIAASYKEVDAIARRVIIIYQRTIEPRRQLELMRLLGHFRINMPKFKQCMRRAILPHSVSHLRSRPAPLKLRCQINPRYLSARRRPYQVCAIENLPRWHAAPRHAAACAPSRAPANAARAVVRKPEMRRRGTISDRWRPLTEAAATSGDG